MIVRRGNGQEDCSFSARHSRQTERQCCPWRPTLWSAPSQGFASSPPPAPVGLRGVAVVQRDGAPKSLIFFPREKKSLTARQAATRAQPLSLQGRRWNEALGRSRRYRRQSPQHRPRLEKALRFIASPAPPPTSATARRLIQRALPLHSQ